MLDEEMDHIIREAAENHHPAYNDKAWEKMEMKLDKHLPQKKDKRRLIFFLLFFALLGGGIIFTIAKLNTVKDTRTADTATANQDLAAPISSAAGNPAADQSSTVQPGAAMQTEGPVNGNATAGSSNVTPGGSSQNLAQQQPLAATNTNVAYFSNNRLSGAYKGKTKTSISNPGLFQDAVTGNGANNANTGKNKTGKIAGKQTVRIGNPEAETDSDDAKTVQANSNSVVKTETKADNKTKQEENGVSDKKQESQKQEAKKETDKKTDNKSPETASAKKKGKNKFGSNFGLTASVGPDMSFVKLNNAGRTTLTYGAGLSYNLSKRFTVKSGFYVSKKVYTASPDEYHSPNGNYPNLTGVDADCKVYEIPVSIAYNFGQRNKHNWFGGAGLSSFIMKSEDYTYNYKSPAGQTYSYYQELKNKNKHYFAVLTLSAGYNYRFTNRLAVQAEPYAKIPMGGVGQGKIKLNSAGVLFTVTYKPFKKKK